MPRVRDGAAGLQAEAVMKVPPDKAVLIRAKKDGRPLRILQYGTILVNPLTETATFLDLDVHTLDQLFRDIDTTLEGTRVPVDIRVEMRVSYCYSSLLTLENADRLSRTPKPVLLGEIVTAIYARLREACIGWSPEELRGNIEAVAGWVLRAVRGDIAPSGLWIGSLDIKVVPDDLRFIDQMRTERFLASRRAALRAAGIDPGPEPPAGMTPQELEAEDIRVTVLEGALEARREASGEWAGDRAPPKRQPSGSQTDGADDAQRG